MAAVAFRAHDDRKGITLGDLFQFIQACDHVGLDPRTPVRVVVGFRGQAKQISATVAEDRATAPLAASQPSPGIVTHPATF